MNSLFKPDKLFPLTWIGYFPQKAEWHKVSMQTFQTENKNVSNTYSALKWSIPIIESSGPPPLKNHRAPTSATDILLSWFKAIRTQSSTKSCGNSIDGGAHEGLLYDLVFPYNEHLLTALCHPQSSTVEHPGRCSYLVLMLYTPHLGGGRGSWVCTTALLVVWSNVNHPSLS